MPRNRRRRRTRGGAEGCAEVRAYNEICFVLHHENLVCFVARLKKEGGREATPTLMYISCVSFMGCIMRYADIHTDIYRYIHADILASYRRQNTS